MSSLRGAGSALAARASGRLAVTPSEASCRDVHGPEPAADSTSPLHRCTAMSFPTPLMPPPSDLPFESDSKRPDRAEEKWSTTSSGVVVGEEKRRVPRLRERDVQKRSAEKRTDYGEQKSGQHTRATWSAARLEEAWRMRVRSSDDFRRLHMSSRLTRKAAITWCTCVFSIQCRLRRRQHHPRRSHLAFQCRLRPAPLLRRRRPSSL